MDMVKGPDMQVMLGDVQNGERVQQILHYQLSLKTFTNLQFGLNKQSCKFSVSEVS